MTMPLRDRYSTPTAFRRALTDKLKALAFPHGPWPLEELQRQFAYDRLLVRLYELDDGWILKGATALLARGIAVRRTIDVDVYRATTREQAEQDLRAALALDGRDWFEFAAGPGTRIMDGAGGVRVPIVARLGAADWTRFRVDVVAEGVRMTGQPDDVPALAEISIAGLDQPGYRAYPLVDHIADKTCAILELRGRARRPSTRYKDLVDLVALVANSRPSAVVQGRALRSEASRRGIALPRRFEVPDEELWQGGYAAEVEHAVLPVARTLSEALDRTRPYLEPLFQRTAGGVWNPEAGIWE